MPVDAVYDMSPDFFTTCGPAICAPGDHEWICVFSHNICAYCKIRQDDFYDSMSYSEYY
jgi:hypothetical protein